MFIALVLEHCSSSKSGRVSRLASAMNGDKPDGGGAGGGRRQAWLTAWHDRVAGLKVPAPRPPALPRPWPARRAGPASASWKGRRGQLLLLLLLLGSGCPLPAALCPRPVDPATTTSSTSASPGHAKPRARIRRGPAG